jgi:tetratricopeptide (TPR) repeat protein
MQSSKGFTIGAFYEVALYYMEKNIRLDDAMKYITAASRSMPNFNVLRTKSELEEKMGKLAESKETFKAAINATNSAQQAHNYARTVLPSDAQRAFNIFKMNYDHYPNVYTTNMGMARGYSAIGNYKEALKYANKALPQAPDANNRTTVEKSIVVLKQGKDINTM